MGQGKGDLAEKSLKQIEDVTQRHYGKDLPQPDYSISVVAPERKTHYRELFSREYIVSTLCVSALWFLQNVGFFGISAFLPLILVAKGLTIVRALQYATIGYVGSVLGAILTSAIGEKMQRKSSFSVFSFLTGVFAIGLAYSTDANEVFLFAFLTTMATWAHFVSLVSYTTEVFPTRLRATGSGWGYAVGRLAGIIGIYVIGFALAGNTIAQILLPAASFILAAVIMTLIGLKTAKTPLEQISQRPSR